MIYIHKNYFTITIYSKTTKQQNNKTIRQEIKFEIYLI